MQCFSSGFLSNSPIYFVVSCRFRLEIQCASATTAVVRTAALASARKGVRAGNRGPVVLLWVWVPLDLLTQTLLLQELQPGERGAEVSPEEWDWMPSGCYSPEELCYKWRSLLCIRLCQRGAERGEGERWGRKRWERQEWRDPVQRGDLKWHLKHKTLKHARIDTCMNSYRKSVMHGCVFLHAKIQMYIQVHNQ